jgi:hypothetical protein
MMNKLLITCCFAIVLSGCAAGMANVHRSNVDIYTSLIMDLGLEAEDTADETRRRHIYISKLTESLSSLDGVSPTEAKVKRDYIKETLNLEL